MSLETRQTLIESGKYTEEIMAKAEDIMHRTLPKAKTRSFEHWLDTPSAPIQSHFAGLAKRELGFV